MAPAERDRDSHEHDAGDPVRPADAPDDGGAGVHTAELPGWARLHQSGHAGAADLPVDGAEHADAGLAGPVADARRVVPGWAEQRRNRPRWECRDGIVVGLPDRDDGRCDGAAGAGMGSAIGCKGCAARPTGDPAVQQGDEHDRDQPGGLDLPGWRCVRDRPDAPMGFLGDAAGGRASGSGVRAGAVVPGVGLDDGA